MQKVFDNQFSHSLSGLNDLKEFVLISTDKLTYDPNGNLLKYSNRKIWSIKYNYLNLPTEIEFTNGNKITNIYSADGRKFKTIFLTLQTEVVALIIKTSPVFGIVGGPVTPKNDGGKYYSGKKKYM